MIGPRNSIVRIFLGEEVGEDEILRDDSEWINTAAFGWIDVLERLPELWVDRVHDHVWA